MNFTIGCIKLWFTRNRLRCSVSSLTITFQVSGLKKKGIRTLVALGGWNDSEGNKYSRMVATKSSRKKFIDSALQFIEKYEFEGLDLDWEYPVCWQVSDNFKQHPGYSVLKSTIKGAN